MGDIWRQTLCCLAAGCRGCYFVQEPEAWALLGHCSYLSGDRAKARQCYQRCLEYQRQPEDTHPVFLRLGSVYLQEGKVKPPLPSPPLNSTLSS